MYVQPMSFVPLLTVMLSVVKVEVFIPLVASVNLMMMGVVRATPVAAETGVYDVTNGEMLSTVKVQAVDAAKAFPTRSLTPVVTVTV